MPEPTIAKKEPAALDLAPGTYWWCACGLSRTQPFCDGSHKGTGFKPLKLEVAQLGGFVLCQCKHTGDAPHCDGTHCTL